MAAQFVTLPALPRTAGGKIDRPRLPAPGRERPLLDADYRAPRGELEGLIADAWGATLGLDRPGAEDNFFELGGHSLLLAQVHARLEAPLAVRFGRELPLIELFQHPTIRSLAEHLAGGEGPEPAVPASRRGARRGERLVERGERGARRRLVLREECALEEVRE